MELDTVFVRDPGPFAFPCHSLPESVGGLRSRLDSHPLVAAATEPAGAGNTPLSAAAGHGRVSCVAELVHRLDRLNSDGFEGKRDAVAAALVRASEFGHADAAAYFAEREQYLRGRRTRDSRRS